MQRKQLGLIVVIVSLIGSGRFIGAADQKGASPAPQESKPDLITQVYDTRDLTTPVQDFPLDTSPQAAAFISPVLRTGTQEGSPAQQRPNLFGSASDPAAPSGKQEMTDSIIKLIQDTVDPESWKDAGGTIGYLREIHGLLFITQTRENQQKVGVLLSDFASQRGVMVRVTADWVLIPSSDLAKLIKPPAGNHEGALQEIDATALKNLSEKTRRFHAETLGFSGQTVHVVSGRVRSVATSATAVVGTGVAAYQPDIAGLGGGIALQVTPRADYDQQSAVVTLYSTFNDPESPIGPMQMITSPPTTQPVVGEGTANTFQPVNTVVQELRTTVKLPLGKPVLVGGMTLEPATKNTDLGQLVLILKVTATR
jgi:hypothetical protein